MDRSALFTDLYQLTMARAYHAEGMSDDAVFELFFRELPESRGFVMAAGLDPCLDFLESFCFTEDELRWLAELDWVDDDYLGWLSELRFRGTVDAVEEGTLVFPNEPILRVVAPLPEAQLVETFLLNQVHFQSIAATKAARMVLAAQGRKVVDFGSRRAHGTDAALAVARTCYLAGADGTSNVLAGQRYGVPTFGTMAHSYIQAHDSEIDAFRAFAQIFPETTLLVDTYDTLRGVDAVVELKQELGAEFRVRAIRLDSGDLADLAKRSRARLDEAGLEQVKIFASSGLDELKIQALLHAEAPIDGFGVGTKLAVSPDAPDLDMAYKLVEYAGQPRMKLSSDKVILPGPKQVFRSYTGGRLSGDVIACQDEQLEGEPLLKTVMREGERLESARFEWEKVRERARTELEALPESLRDLESPGSYEVRQSEALRERLETTRARVEE